VGSGSRIVRLTMAAGLFSLYFVLEGNLRYLAAARAHGGIRRIGYLSSLIKDYEPLRNWWVFRHKNEAVDKIKRSGLCYNIYYASAFMETVVERNIRNGKLLLAGRQVGQSWWIAGADYGHQVAQAFALPEAAHVFTKHYPHRAIKLSQAPLGVLRFMGNFNRELAFVSKIITSLNQYPERFAAQPTWDLLGAPQTTMAQFAAALPKGL